MGGGSSKEKTEVISAKSSAQTPQSRPNLGPSKDEGPSSSPMIESSPAMVKSINQEPMILTRNESDASSMQNDLKPSAVAK